MTRSLRQRIEGWRKHIPEFFGYPLQSLVNVGRAIGYPVLALVRSPVRGSVLIAATVLIAVPTATPPLGWLPEPGEGGAILGSLLAAQAAIAAFTLAVTLFVMQGIRARSDVDERTHREYVRRSWVRNVLWISLLSAAVTGLILVSEQFTGRSELIANYAPGLPNLLLVAGLGFLINLVLAGTLFERALLLSGPEQWMALRREVIKTDVRNAIQAFLHRARRAYAALEANQPDFTTLTPDQDEGSANEAVHALLDAARRAMAERRHQEFKRSFDSVKELVKYAVDELKTAGIKWGAPGNQPEWPPIRELRRNLYPFREDVIRDGDRDYIFELLSLDHWLTTEGMRNRCGELFSVGLDGYRSNYQIANRIGSESLELLRDRFALHVDTFILGVEPKEAFLYVQEMIRLQERLLSDALHSDQASDFEQLHSEFVPRLRAIGLHWRSDERSPSEASGLLRQLEQEYRVSLMGLIGRAILLAQPGRIRDVNPYLQVGRRIGPELEPMANDLAAALSDDSHSHLSMWDEWEYENAEPYQATFISAERYPLTFFALRLLELSSGETPTFELHGRAQRALDWFNGNWESVGSHVPDEPGLTLDQRREYAVEALRRAVHKDEASEDFDIIGRALSATRVVAFKSDVYSAAFSDNAVIQWFNRAGAILYLPSDADNAPNEQQVFPQFMHKGFLTNTPETAQIGYAPLSGERWGTALSDLVLRKLYETLRGAPEMFAPLDTPQALLHGVDRAIEELNGPDHVIVLLAGNWFDQIVELGMQDLEGYEESWKLPESDRLGEIGRFRGHPIIRAYGHVGRCVYVVDPAGWGRFVCAKAGGDRDLRIEINPVNIERARELLTANPNHFPDEPDEESKLRKLQTQVEIIVGARTGFSVTDPSRARRITPIRQTGINGEESTV